MLMLLALPAPYLLSLPLGLRHPALFPTLYSSRPCHKIPSLPSRTSTRPLSINAQVCFSRFSAYGQAFPLERPISSLFGRFFVYAQEKGRLSVLKIECRTGPPLTFETRCEVSAVSVFRGSNTTNPGEAEAPCLLEETFLLGTGVALDGHVPRRRGKDSLEGRGCPG